MEYEKIDEIRQYLIEKYGEPIEQKIGNYTYKKINGDLNTFNRFISAILNCCDLVGLDNVEKQINAICEYAKIENPNNLETIAERLEVFAKEFSKKVNFSRNRFKNMMLDLGVDLEKADFNPKCIINYFVQYLRIRSIDYNIKADRNYQFTKKENLPYSRDK